MSSSNATSNLNMPHVDIAMILPFDLSYSTGWSRAWACTWTMNWYIMIRLTNMLRLASREKMDRTRRFLMKDSTTRKGRKASM